METIYPYRVAWHAPPPVNVRSSSRGALLDAIEYEFPTSKARLTDLTGLGEATVRRACRQLIREGVLTLKYGPDPDTGHASDLISVARYPVLPVLEITRAYMIWRLCDTCGGSVFATVRDRGGFCSPEDDLMTLMGQVQTIMRAGTCGLPAKVPLQPPVLLLPAKEVSLVSLVRRVLDAPPAVCITPDEATAMEIRYLPDARDARSVLHLRTGEVCSVSLLARESADDLRAPLRPAPWAAGLDQTLREYTGDLHPHTAAWWKQVAAFLRDLCRFVTPDCAVVEFDRDHTVSRLLRTALPPTVKLVRVNYALNTPSLAHRGALRLTRRTLWDGMESEKPNG